MSPLFQPQDPDDVREFMDSVKPKSTVAHHIVRFGSKLTQTAFGVATAPLAAGAAVGEAASYASANVTGLLPVGFNSVGKICSDTRTKIGELSGLELAN